ncbi:MAG: hypothetical protein IPO21_00010 [Bacteroidales bacterium]|nr:hypothetical protein [Bacteroidales bacterium]
MNMQDFLKKKFIIFFSLCLIVSIQVFAQTTTFSGTGNWSNAGNWNNGVPDGTKDVIIANGAQCTVDANANCKSLTFAVNNTANSSLSISGASILSISGNIAYSAPTADFTQTVAVNGGILNCDNINMPNVASASRRLNLTAVAGTINVANSIAMLGDNTENWIEFTGAGFLNVGVSLGTGDFGRLIASASIITIGRHFNVNVFTANTSTVIFNGTVPQRVDNVSYYNLQLENSARKYLASSITVLANGSLSFNNGLLDLSGFDLTMQTGSRFLGTPSSSSFIDFANGGRLIRTGNALGDWQTVFPIGTGSDYSPFEITNATGDINGTLIVTISSSRHTLLNGVDNAIKRFWNLSSTDLNLSGSTGSFFYTDNDVSGAIVEANLTTVGRLSSTAGWVENEVTTTFNHTANSVSFNGTQLLGIWTLGEASGCFDYPLPTKYTVAHGSWSTPSTWNNSTVPVAGDDVAILHNITNNVATGITMNNLIIGKDGNLNCERYAVTVSGTTEVFGKITDNRNEVPANTFVGLLTIHPNASVSTANNGDFVFQGGILNNGTFSQSGGGTFTCSGGITNNSIFSKTGAGIVTFNGEQTINNASGLTMDITGAITKDATGKLTITNAASSPISLITSFTTNSDVDITGLSDITSTGAFTINTASTVSNQNTGIVTISGALNGNDAGSTWINEANTTLYYRNTTQPFNTNGNLNVSTNPNKVIYGLNGNQTIRTTGTTYHNLNIESGGTKTVSGLLTVNGDCTIKNGLTVSTTINNIVIGGDLLIGNSAVATLTQTSGTLTASNLIVNGSSTLNYNAQATIANDITIELGSNFANGTANTINNLTLQGDLIVNGTFDLYTDTDSRTNLIIDGDTPHLLSGTPTLFQLNNFTINPSSNTTDLGFTIDVESSVSIGAGSTLAANAHNHTVLGNWTNDGTLSSSGTVTFDGGTQTIGAEPNFNNIIFSTAGTKTVSGAVSTLGDFEISGGATINTTVNNITIGGSLVASNSATATLTQTTGTLSATNLTANGGNIFNFNANATISNDIAVSNNSILNLNSGGATIFNYIVANDITVALGSTFAAGTSNYTNNLTLQGHLLVNGGFDLWYDGDSRTNLIIDGNTAHSFSGTPTAFQLYNFTTNASSNTTDLGFAIDAEGSVSIGASSTLAANAHSHTVLGNWTNDGILSSSGTVTFDGGTQTIGAEPNFNNIAFSTAGNKYFLGDITATGNFSSANATVYLSNDATAKTHTFHGDLTLTSGFLYAASVDGIHTLNIGGNLQVDGTLDLYSSATRYATLSFVDNVSRSISGTPVLFDLYNLDLAANSNTTALGFDIVTGANYFIRNNINVASNATLSTNSHNLDIYGNIMIAANGTLNVNDNSVLTFYAASKFIENSGNLIIEGTSGNNARLTASAVANRFYVNNLSGSSLQMKYFDVDYLTGIGITLAAGGIADAIADNFSFGTFGANCNSTQCLDLSGVDFTSNNPVIATSTVFNTVGTYNISRTGGTGLLQFVDATGTKAGESFDNDNGNPGTLISWTYPATSYFTVASGDFMNPAIWNADPTGHFADATSVFQIMDGHDVILNGDIDVLELIVGEGTSGSLAIGNNTTARTMTIREQLKIYNGASVNVGSAATHIVKMYGNISNDGTSNFRTTSSNVANVEFYGPSSKINGLNTTVFNTVIFKSGTVATAYRAMDINQNVEIETGAVFNDGGLRHTVARNWTETGTGQRTGLGTIVFDGTVSIIQATDATTVEFFNAECSGTGAVDFASSTVAFTTAISGSFTVADTKEVQLTDDQMTVTGNFTVSPSARFTVTTAALTFNGNADQSIDLTGDAVFYDLVFSGTGIKTVIGNIKNTRYFTINAGATVAGNGSHIIGNTFTVNGTCNFSGEITVKAGNITSTNIVLDFAHIQNLYIDGSIYLTTLSTLDVIINGNLQVLTGSFYINNNTSLSCSGAGIFTLNAGSVLYVRDDNGFPTGFSSYILNPTSITRYDADLDQIVRGGADLNYGILYVFNNTNAVARTKTADGIIDVEGRLYLGDDPILFDLQGFDFNIAGNIENASLATIDMTDGGTLTLDAEDAPQSMWLGTYNLTNLNFTLASPISTRTKTINSGATVSMLGNLTASCGSTGSFLLDIALLDNVIAGTPQNITLGANCRLSTTIADFGTDVLSNFLGSIDVLNGTVHYASTTETQLIADGLVYGNLAFSGTQIKEAKGNLDINGSISVVNNTPYFKAGGYTHQIAGEWLLGIGNTRVADMMPTDKIIFDGIVQTIAQSNFQTLEIANSGVCSLYGTLSIYGDFNVKNAAQFDALSENITMYGNTTFEPTGIFIQQTTGTVTFASITSDQVIASNPNSYYGNITITKNDGATNQTLTAATDVIIKNNLFLTTNTAVFDLNNNQLKLGGFLTVNENINIGTNAFIPGNGMVILDGLDIQEIRHYSAYPLTFHDLTFNSTTNKSFRCYGVDPSRLISVTGDFTNNGQNFYGYINNDAGNTYVNFNVAGNWTNNGTFYHLNAGTVLFNGNNQDIGKSDFWNVIFGGTGTKLLRYGNMTVKANLTISDGVTLDVDEVENNSILISNNWDMSAAGAVFIAREGLVRFDGGGTIITGLAAEDANKNFYDVEISANFGLSGTLDVDNDFTIISGTFTTGTNSVYLGGSFVNVGGTFTHTNSPLAHLIFNATVGNKTIDAGASGTAFNLTSIDAAPGIEYTVENNFSINNNNNFTINSGILKLNGKKITVNSANTKILINTSGVFDINEGSIINFTNNSQSIFNEGGVLKIVGTEENVATLTRSGGSYYIVQNTGVLHANYYRCEMIGSGANGCLTINGGSLDETNNLSNGTFFSGASTANTTAYINLNGLQIDNATNLTIENITFNGGGTTNKNVRRNLPPPSTNNGYVEFQDCIGSLSGALNEMDDNNATTGFVRWTYPNGFFWQGDVSADWHDGANWAGGIAPSDSSHFVYFDPSLYIGPNPIARITGDNAVCGKIVLNSGVAFGVSLENNYDLTIYGAVVVNTGTSINVTSANSEINAYGDWTNAGTFTHGSAKVNFLAPSGVVNISQSTVSPFYNVEFYSTHSASFVLGSNLAFNGNFTLTKGSIDVLTRDITVKGDWFVNVDSGAVFYPQTRTVTFDGGDQTIKNGTLFNVTNSGTGTKLLLSNIDINGTFTISAGVTFNGQEYEIYVGTNWTNNNIFTQTGLGMVIFDGGNQQIDVTGSSETRFNKLTFAGNGTKTFYKPSDVWGDFVINSGCIVSFGSHIIDGGVASNSFINNGSIYLNGVDNFPTAFETISMSATSIVLYYYNGGDQIIRTPDDTWAYGNLYLRNSSATSYKKITEAGNLKIAGNLYIDNTTVLLDVNTNSTNITLTGSIVAVTGCQQIEWGTGTTKLTHIGGDWTIDKDITLFNNLELNWTGSRWTRIAGNISITGDFTIKSGSYLLMDPDNSSSPFRITSTVLGKTFLMETGSRLYCALPSATGPAMPVNFTNYNIHPSSTVYLRAGNGINQTIYTGNGIVYGGIVFQNTKTVTTDGIATFQTMGNLNMGTCIFNDAGRSVSTAGSTTTLYDYTPTSGVTFTFNGANQTINNTNQIYFENVVFAGSGTKTLGSNSTILISGNVIINPNITVASSRNTTFNGSAWTNNGIYRNTVNFTVSGLGNQAYKSGCSK